MIPAPPGIVARYKHEDGKYHSELAVIAFNTEGEALVLGESGLVPATGWRNFDTLSDSPQHSEYAQLIPAGGWRVEFTREDGAQWSEPLAAWALKSNGAVTPLTVDNDGYIDDFDHYGGTYRIYHPGSDPEPGTDADVAPDVTGTGEAALPLEGYDALTIASLRARLRVLTVPQLEALIAHEKVHQRRKDVIGMLRRRAAKVTGESR